MRYLFLIYLDEAAAAARAEPVKSAAIASHQPYIEALRRNGRYVGSERLLPSRAARILRNVDGKALVTQGPFAESREQLGGFYLVDAKDLDQAIADAAECPALKTVATAIEIRPVFGAGAAGEPSEHGEGRYLLGIYETQAQAENEEARQAAAARWTRYLERLRAAGQLIGGEPLAPAGSATTLRLRDGKVVLTDGPFAESGEQLGGYCLVRARDLDQAAAIAQQCPAAPEHAIEIRGIAQ